MVLTIEPPAVDLEHLRRAIQDEYALVVDSPDHGFDFVVRRPLAQLLGNADYWLHSIPEATIPSCAGTGNPFSLGARQPGERVVILVQQAVPQSAKQDIAFWTG
jgi:hypothetical protein